MSVEEHRCIPDVRECLHSHPGVGGCSSNVLVDVLTDHIGAGYGKVLSAPEARWSPILYGNRGFLRVGSNSQERAAPLHPSLHVPLWLPSCSVAMGSTF